MLMTPLFFVCFFSCQSYPLGLNVQSVPIKATQVPIAHKTATGSTDQLNRSV